MRALTIRHPHVEAITVGAKRVENRTWKPTPATLRPGHLLAIHAGHGVDKHVSVEGILDPVPAGHVVAVTLFLGAHRHGDDTPGGRPDLGLFDCCAPHGLQARWALPDHWHWRLGYVVALPEPVPAKGSLGLWLLPADVEDAVTAQLARTVN